MSSPPSTTLSTIPVQNTPPTTSAPSDAVTVTVVATPTSTTTPLPTSSPAPSAPPRKKRRAPPPPVPANVQPPPTAPPSTPIPTTLPSTTLPNVSAPSIPTPVVSPTTLPSAVPPAVPILPVAAPTPKEPIPQATPTEPIPPVAAPLAPILPPTTPITTVQNPSPPTGVTETPPKPPPPPAPLATPPTGSAPPKPPPPSVPTNVPSTVPISTKAPSVQPTSPNSIASYLSLASVALGKIPNTPLPVVPTPLPTSATPGQPVLPCSSARRQNLMGFEDGNWYKIRNVGDNSVVQLDQDGSKFICMEENDDKAELQLFRAIEQANGSYRIMSKMQKSTDSIQVWDYLPHRGLLHQKKQSEKTDKYQQNWKSVAVQSFNSLYLIQSGPNPEMQNCLKNMGIGEQIKLITKDEKAALDHFAHWHLELQE